MNKQYISVHYKTASDANGIIAAILMDAGYDGVEEGDEEIIISIHKELYNEAWLQHLMQDHGVSYYTQTIESQNWNAQWEQSFAPVQVGDFAAIRASFHAAIPGVLYDIIITPKMSFGTGHHATTYLMMEQMQQINFKNKSVLDFGTGTGVLAILAEKLGAAKIIATDNDEWSINNAMENMEANQCSGIELIHAQDLLTNMEKVDVILANINLNVIIANLDAIKSCCSAQSVVLFSGILKEDQEKICEALQAKGLGIINIVHRNGWICIYAQPVSFL